MWQPTTARSTVSFLLVRYRPQSLGLLAELRLTDCPCRAGTAAARVAHAPGVVRGERGWLVGDDHLAAKPAKPPR